MANDGRLCAATRIGTLRTNQGSTPGKPWATAGKQSATAGKQLSAAMAATLSVELEGRVPEELVAEIVRAVLDENRLAARDRSAEFPMLEARLRLERFIRARAAS